jgi:hypothetical protein
VPHHSKDPLKINTSSRSVTLSTSRCSQTSDAAETWFEENDPEGVAFEYEVLE